MKNCFPVCLKLYWYFIAASFLLFGIMYKIIFYTNKIKGSRFDFYPLCTKRIQNTLFLTGEFLKNNDERITMPRKILNPLFWYLIWIQNVLRKELGYILFKNLIVYFYCIFDMESILFNLGYRTSRYFRSKLIIKAVERNDLLFSYM